MERYEHRQLSRWMIGIMAVFAVIFLVAGFSGEGLPLRFAAFLLVASTIAFSSLTTRVDANGVSWAFALGAPGGRIPFNDIAEVQITTTNFWEGFGIHWTLWHGWLWNVEGYGAVMIHKKSGGVLTLGTDDPQGLYDAIARNRSAAA